MEIESWLPFKNFLRKDDRQSYDDMINFSLQCRKAADNAHKPVTFDALTISMLLAQHELIKQLQSRLAELPEHLQ